MMPTWTDEKIAYMRDALRFSDYYAAIARQIVPFLPPQAHLCDAGCGLGALGRALLPYCRTVTCVDVSPEAIAVAAQGAPEDLHVLCGDISALSPAIPYDAMVFCLFGGVEQTLEIAARQCRGPAFLIKRDYTHHRFSTEDVPLGDYTAAHTEEKLRALGVCFRSISFSAEFGQPFRSMTDALRFFDLYNRSDRDFSPEEIAAQLVTTPSSEFPLYLPYEKKLRLFVLP